MRDTVGVWTAGVAAIPKRRSGLFFLVDYPVDHNGPFGHRTARSQPSGMRERTGGHLGGAAASLPCGQ